MELGEAREVRTTCPYCGVGCGVLAKVAPAREKKLPPPPPPQTQKKKTGGIKKKQTTPITQTTN
ncbi:hypothetical protein [Mesorhizobium sp. M1153]|uniref:hypothetical protein n=1 Tax=Mesorhizobium sp. M1153 TaxID=2957063 RepID=UPI0033365C42